MRDSSLVHGKLVRRYKRFLADVLMDTGETVTAHCPNTGSMKNCIEEGADVWLSRSDNPARKYPLTWEFIRTSRCHYIGINTIKANGLVKNAILEDRIAEIRGYPEMKTEKRYGSENSRIDIFLSGHPVLAECYVEVKSVTLLEKPFGRGVGCFPDAVSKRGAKHLRELMRIAKGGRRAVLFFCVQHSGIHEVRPATHIDPVYAETLDSAVDAGVEVLAYKVRYQGRLPVIGRSLPFVQKDSGINA
jgi:sugar fermentation stimulation protein A